jgi:hypothetical protein
MPGRISYLREECNGKGPNRSLGYRTPTEFAETLRIPRSYMDEKIKVGQPDGKAARGRRGNQRTELTVV